MQGTYKQNEEEQQTSGDDVGLLWPPWSCVD